MKNKYYKLGWLLCRTVFRILFGLRPVNVNRVPPEGAVIVAANHVSYFDPPMLGAGIKREMYFFAKKELFSMFIFGWLIRRLNTVPVRRGVYDPAALSRAADILANDGGLIMFPEGTRGSGDGFLPPKPGIGLIAKQSRVPIIPAYLYRTDRLWKSFLTRRRVKVFFGQPMAVEEIDRFSDDKNGYRMLAELVMERITCLKMQAVSG